MRDIGRIVWPNHHAVTYSLDKASSPVEKLKTEPVVKHADFDRRTVRAVQVHRNAAALIRKIG